MINNAAPEINSDRGIPNKPVTICHENLTDASTHEPPPV